MKKPTDKLNKRYLIGGYFVRGFGGASAAPYALFEKMQDDNVNVAYLDIYESFDREYYNDILAGNQSRRSDAFGCCMEGPIFLDHPELAECIREIAPEVMIGVGYISAFVMKKAVPEIPLLFLTSGCSQVKSYLADAETPDAIAVREMLLRGGKKSAYHHRREAEAADFADIIITHADIIREFYQLFYPEAAAKLRPEIVWFADWICREALIYQSLKKPFDQRDINMLFIANNWERGEKNYPLVKEIAAASEDFSMHVVGGVPEVIPGVTHHGTISERRQIFSLLGAAKTVVCPSKFDAAPGILFEAAMMDCNLVASKNCGNWKICHKDLLADPPSLKNYLEKIRLANTRKFPDNSDYFLAGNAYETFLSILKTVDSGYRKI